MRIFIRNFIRNKLILIGLIGVFIFILLGLFGNNISSLFIKNLIGPPYNPPSLTYLLGTDYQGNNLLYLLIIGTQSTIEVGFLSGLFALFLGFIIGTISGIYGKYFDEILMRATDFFIIIPTIILAIIFISILGPSTVNYIIIIGGTSWPSIARIIRSDILVNKTKDFILFAKIGGASNSYIILKHLIPLEIPLILPNFLLSTSGAILTYAGLNFLGFGSLSLPNWGLILYEAELNGAIIVGAWWVIIFPGIFLIFFVLSLVILSKGIEKVFMKRSFGEVK
ncbi:MAG: ABC transporter permease [Minisyncoccia bacterium]|jgi:peptide/nickel transport system permease protein